MIDHYNKIIFLHIPKTAGTSIIRTLLGVQPHQHLDWWELKEKHKEYWDGYYKFTVVRNPFDWLVSMYHGMYGGDPNTWPAFGDVHKPIAAYMEFSEFIKNLRQVRAPGKPFSQVDIAGPEMDQIIKFENLGNEFRKLCEDRDLRCSYHPAPYPSPLELFSDNGLMATGGSGPRKERTGEYKSYYTPEIVEKELEKDLKTFGYSYE